MANLRDWCNSTNTSVKTHTLSYIESDATKLPTAVTNIAAVVPGHYAAANRVAHILARLGKHEAAAYVTTKLPVASRSRSGDIGEILASHWVSEFTDYKLGVLKLRWKDHREMAMRGDDILAARLDPAVGIRFLKGEVKSRAILTKQTVQQARTALLSSNERPTPHALAFVSDRMFEAGATALSDLIDDCQLKKRIKTSQVSHLMFMFTGNNSSKLLTADLVSYKGTIQQYAVGLRVSTHQAFIRQIFDKVIADGNRP